MSMFLNSDELDDGSIVVNVEEMDQYGNVKAKSGYVHIRYEDNIISVTVFGKDGSVINQHEYVEEEFI